MTKPAPLASLQVGSLLGQSVRLICISGYAVGLVKFVTVYGTV